MRQATLRAVQEGAPAEYALWSGPDSRLLGENRPQGIDLIVGRDGLRVRPRGGAHNALWELRLRLSAVGRGEERGALEPGAARVSQETNRASIVHDAGIGYVTDWYLNGPLGIEHGVVLDRAPRGRADAALTLEVEVSGDLTPVERAGGAWISLHERDGTPALWYAGLFAHDATGRPLVAWMEVHGDTIVLNVEDREATYPVTIDPLVFTETRKLVASDASDQDLFGWSVAVSGDTAIVGASDGWAAYVFERNLGGTDAWGERKKLVAGDGGRLGWAVALEGDTALVGAPYTGAAYVFERNLGGPDSWGERKRILPSTLDFSFGASVALSGDTALIGSPSEDGIAGISIGAAYLFERHSGGPDNWGELTRIAANDGEEGDHFGVSVVLSSDTALVGAQQVDLSRWNEGAAYLFERDLGGPGNWGQRKRLVAIDAEPDDWLGISVALSADTAVVGGVEASGSDGDRCTDPGKAYVYERDLGGIDNWGARTQLLPSDADNCFGWAVALEGDTALVGAFGGEAMTPGSAHVFERNLGGADSWGEQKKLTAGDAESGDRFGWAVALSGNTAIVGAPHEGDVGAVLGAAYVFDRRLVGTSCTSGAECETGFCVDDVCCDDDCGGGNPDDCQACSVIAGATIDGICAPLDGPACDDGLFCTAGDTCSDGACVGVDPCAANVGDDDANCFESCDENADACTAVDPDDSPCEDGLFCTAGDRCSAGVCVGGGDPCAANLGDADDDCSESCDEAADACTALDPDESACDDGSFCTGADSCLSGNCVGAGDPCVINVGDADPDCTESCNELHDSCINPDPDGSACDDHRFCTIDDTCQSGMCVGTGDPCAANVGDADDDCSESCSDAQRDCVAPDPSGSACDDGLFCTGVDTCESGVCVGDGDPCAINVGDGDADCSESCDETEDACSAPDPDDSACDDGLYCTGADTCSSGACLGAGDPCAANVGDDDEDCSESCSESTDDCSEADPDDSPCSGGICAGGACVPVGGGEDGGADAGTDATAVTGSRSDGGCSCQLGSRIPVTTWWIAVWIAVLPWVTRRRRREAAAGHRGAPGHG